MNKHFPISDMELTHILVVSNMEHTRHFYKDVLGVIVMREYSDTSCVLKFQGSWLLLVTEGKPTITFAPPTNPYIVSHSMTIRVEDCQTAYEILKSRGAEFLTPPVDWGTEMRCFFRDPDGHLLEISQVI